LTHSHPATPAIPTVRPGWTSGPPPPPTRTAVETYRGWQIVRTGHPRFTPIYVAAPPGGDQTKALLEAGLVKLRRLVDLELDGPPPLAAHLTLAIADRGHGLVGWSAETLILTFPDGDVDAWHTSHHHSDKHARQPRLTHDHSAQDGS
jgi:hypothetical protein